MSDSDSSEHPHAPVVGPGCASPDARRGMHHALIAEDDLPNQHMLARIMGHLGFDVMVAGTGAQAVSIFNTRAIDLVLMDIQMPEMDGIEATLAIRAIEASRRAKAPISQSPTLTPIIAVTANIDPLTRQACLTAGMNDYLNKPIRKSLLERAISQLCPRWRAP